MDLEGAQKKVDEWIKTHGVRYFDELTNMAQLTEEITTTENKVSFARQAYNDSVTEYNTYKQTFPPVAVAGTFGHANNATLLEFDSEAIAEAPKVSF